MHRGRRPARPPGDSKPVKALKGDFNNSGRCRVHFEYYSPTTQTWLFSWSKHLHPLSECYSHLAYQLFNFSKNRFQPFEEEVPTGDLRSGRKSFHLPIRSVQIKDRSISDPRPTFTDAQPSFLHVTQRLLPDGTGEEQENSSSPVAGGTLWQQLHLTPVIFRIFTVFFNKQRSQSLNAPNALVKRFIDVCISNFPSQDRLKSLCSQGGLPRWDTPCLPDLMSHSLQITLVSCSFGQRRTDDPARQERAEPGPARPHQGGSLFCLHPHLDFSPTTARVESANPKWSERQR